MTRRLHLAGGLAAFVTAAGLSHALAPTAEAESASEPKHEIKEVMRSVHIAPEGERSLRDVVLSGQASDEQKRQLLDFYISLAEQQPPRGDADAWHEKTDAVLLAAAKVVVGREGADAELRRATNCVACHKDHKPPQD